jgi:putative ABC transport system ATP-binding protein
MTDDNAGTFIAVNGISKRYHKDADVVDALLDVSVGIERGQFIAITGPSGSGKSTLMNMIGLLDRPDRGTFHLDGRDVSTLHPDELAAIRNRRIGFVFQAFHLLPRTPAVENVELPLMYSDRTDIRGLAMRALERVDLTDRARHLPSELSGGQQQRVAIARALVNEPDLLLADEPTGNLDLKSGLEVMDVLQGLHREGKTVVLITHDPELASMAERRIRLVDGRITSDEPVDNRRDARQALGALAEV